MWILGFTCFSLQTSQSMSWFSRALAGTCFRCLHHSAPHSQSPYTWGHGAMAARLTPDQKVGSSNLSALICHSCRSLAFPHPKHAIPHLTQQHLPFVHSTLLVFLTICNKRDSLPEWSKGVGSGSTSTSCVGSNPTAGIYAVGSQKG